MLVFDLAVAVFVVVVLLLIVPLRAVGVVAGAVYLELRQQEDLLGGGGDVAGVVASAAGVVAVLGAVFDGVPPRRREGVEEGGADGLHHVAVFPPAGVGVRGVHAEAGSGAAVALDKGDVSAVRRLSELEVDTVALHALVVVEAQDEGVDCLVQREASEGAVHGDADFVAYRPVAGPGASCAHGLDGGWVVVGQRFAGQADGGGADRAGRGGVVGTGGDGDRDLRGALGLAGDGDGGAGEAGLRDGGVVYRHGDRAVSGPGDRDGLLKGRYVQRHRGGVDGQGACRLANAPGGALGPVGAVAPLEVACGREGGLIAPGVGTAGGAAHVQLHGAVIVPGGRLGAAGVGEASALSGQLDGFPLDRPGDRPGVLGAVAPDVLSLRGEGRLVLPGVGALRHAAQGELLRVIAVPGGGLDAGVVDQGAVLRRRGADRIGDVLDALGRFVCGLLGLFGGGCCGVCGGFGGVRRLQGLVGGALGGVGSALGGTGQRQGAVCGGFGGVGDVSGRIRSLQGGVGGILCGVCSVLCGIGSVRRPLGQFADGLQFLAAAAGAGGIYGAVSHGSVLLTRLQIRFSRSRPQVRGWPAAPPWALPLRKAGAYRRGSGRWGRCRRRRRGIPGGSSGWVSFGR